MDFPGKGKGKRSPGYSGVGRDGSMRDWVEVGGGEE